MSSREFLVSLTIENAGPAKRQLPTAYGLDGSPFYVIHRRIQELKLGGKVERRRREPSRGAEGVKGDRFGEGVSLSTERGISGGAIF